MRLTSRRERLIEAAHVEDAHMRFPHHLYAIVQVPTVVPSVAGAACTPWMDEMCRLRGKPSNSQDTRLAYYRTHATSSPLWRFGCGLLHPSGGVYRSAAGHLSKGAS